LLNTPKTSSRSRWLVAVASSLSLLLKNFPSFVAKAVVVKPRKLSLLLLFLSLFSEFLLEREAEEDARLVILSRLFPYG
jgi:hypothetical protein